MGYNEGPILSGRRMNVTKIKIFERMTVRATGLLNSKEYERKCQHEYVERRR